MKRHSRGASDPPRGEAKPNENRTTTKQTQDQKKKRKNRKDLSVSD